MLSIPRVRFKNLIVLFLLNPFVLSGIYNIGSDVSIFYLLSILLVAFLKDSRILIVLSLTFLFDRTSAFYLLIFYLIFFEKLPKIDRLDINIFLGSSLFLLILQVSFPNVYESLFFRDLLDDSSRGFSSFGPEPATAALILLSMALLFENSISIYQRLGFTALLLATFSPIAIIGLVLIYRNIGMKKGIFIFLSLIVILIEIGPEIQHLRVFQLLSKLSNEELMNVLEQDRSLSVRLNAVRVPKLMLQRLDFFGFDYRDVFVGSGSARIPLLITAGFLARLSQLGIVLVALILLVLYRIRSLNKFIIFCLFLFVGSIGHLFPLIYLLKHDRNNYPSL